MDRTQLRLLIICLASPALAALVGSAMPFSPVTSFVMGALIGVVLLWPALRISESRGARIMCERILNVIPYPIAVKNAKSELLLVNDAMLEHKGMHREAMIGTTAHQQGESDERIAERLEEDRMALAGLPIWKEEYIACNPGTGKEMYQVVTKGRCKGLYGEQMIVTFQFDTTELNLSRQQLQEEVEKQVRLREGISGFIERLIDIIPQPVYIKDEQSRYLMVNKAFIAFRKLPAKDLIGKSPLELSKDPVKASFVMDEDQAVLRGDNIDKEEEDLHPVTREPIFRFISKRSCVDAEGHKVLVGINFDTTTWRLAEREVKLMLAREQSLRERTQAFLQRIIDVIPQPVYVKDAASRYLLVNTAMSTDMHKESHELIGKDPLDLGASPEYAGVVFSEDRRIINGDQIYKEEHITHPYTGRQVARIISKRSCLDTDGQPVIVGTNFDVTPLRQAERAAAAASEAKSVFLATMSHEIRTPLNGVIGMLRMAVRRELDDTTREQLEVSLRSAESLLTLINDILDFSKIEAGQLRLEDIDFNLEQTVNDALALFRVSADERDIELHVDLPDSVGRFYRGDPTRVRQILVNLVGNALKFTQQGSIRVRFLAAGNKGFSCEVIDTGIGIPAEALPRMFQRFQQADSSTTRTFGGTGLGLAICKELVSAMGGQIAVSSTVGIGTCFRFELPLSAGQAPATPALIRTTTPIRKLHLLCVDDSPTNQLIVRAMLEACGHEVSLADSGIAALKMLSKASFDAVFMDERMPGLDGIAATRAIRAGQHDGMQIRSPNIPVIALTANVSAEDVAQFKAAGADDFLAKPIDENRLTEILQGIAARAPAATENTAPGARPSIEARVRQLVIHSLPERIEEIDKALGNHDYAALSLLFHSLKGNIGYCGDSTLIEHAARLEAAALSHDDEAVRTQWPHLRDELARLSSLAE